MPETSGAPQPLTRRRFIAGVAVAAASLALPLAPQKAYAWDSYSGFVASAFCDPMHEDMTQIAYVRLLQDMTGPPPDASNVSGSVLYAADNATYQEVVQYLRQGAFWNDVPANTGYEFGLNYLWANSSIPPYKKNNVAGSYDTTFDVARHVAQAHQHMKGLMAPWAYARALVRFSSNKRGNMLHSMLGVEVDGVTYLSQKKQRNFSMQWVEAAYKYASGASLTDEQQGIMGIIDTYEQLKGASNDGEEDADRAMSAKQMKLRAIGMLCHTIEDSYNPAHTIRSYYSGNDKSVKFGDILAFGNYEAQNIHGDYDHIASTSDACLDTQTRKALIEGSANYDAAKKLTKVKDRVDALYTMGLQLSSEAVYKLFTFLYAGKPWEGEVQQWFDGTVFKCYFNGEDTYVYDGGRRVGNLQALHDDAHDVTKAIARYIKHSEVKSQMKNTVSLYKKLIEYRATINQFYHRADRTKNAYRHENLSIETSGLATAQDLVDQFYEVLFTLATEAERTAVKSWAPGIRQKLYRAIKGAEGLTQEFSLDLNGEIDQDRYDKAAKMLTLISAEKMGEVTGFIEYATDKDFALRLNDGTGTVVCAFDSNTSFTGRNDMLKGMRDVTVSFDIERLGYPSSVMSCTANVIDIPAGTQVFDAKGTVESLDNGVLLVAIEGSADIDGVQGRVAFKVPASASLGGLVVGTRIIVEYAYDAHGFTYMSHEPVEGVASLQQSGTVVSYYGGMMVLNCGEDENGGPIEKVFEYGETDFVGALSVGANVEVLYYARDEELLGGQQTLKGIFDGVPVPYEASRIAVASLENPDYIFCSNENATHQKIDGDLALVVTENCTNENGVCPLCGYVFAAPKPDPKPDPVNPAKKEPLSKVGEGAAPWVAAAAAVAAVGSGVAAGVAKRFRRDTDE